MAGSEYDAFLERLHYESSKDILFIEFLQQLFPWVYNRTDAPGEDSCRIGWAIKEVSGILYAAETYSEGYVRLVRGTSDRPRGSWSYLLHGKNTTERLRVKLVNLILEIFHFASPDMDITRHSWYDDTISNHQSGVFRDRIRLWHTDSDSPTAPKQFSIAVSPIRIRTVGIVVFVHVESPDGQGHLLATDRDVIITIKPHLVLFEDVPENLQSSQVSINKHTAECDSLMKISINKHIVDYSDDNQDDDIPDLESSDSDDELISTLKPETIREASGISRGISTLVRLNAVCLPSNNQDLSDGESSAESDSTLCCDLSQDRDGIPRIDSLDVDISSKGVEDFKAASAAAATSSTAIEQPWARLGRLIETKKIVNHETLLLRDRIDASIANKIAKVVTCKAESRCKDGSITSTAYSATISQDNINVLTDSPGTTFKNTPSTVQLFPEAMPVSEGSKVTLCNYHRVHNASSEQFISQVCNLHMSTLSRFFSLLLNFFLSCCSSDKVPIAVSCSLT